MIDLHTTNTLMVGECRVTWWNHGVQKTNASVPRPLMPDR